MLSVSDIVDIFVGDINIRNNKSVAGLSCAYCFYVYNIPSWEDRCDEMIEFERNCNYKYLFYIELYWE